jgi:hypothetical protein
LEFHSFLLKFPLGLPKKHSGGHHYESSSSWPDEAISFCLTGNLIALPTLKKIFPGINTPTPPVVGGH